MNTIELKYYSFLDEIPEYFITTVIDGESQLLQAEIKMEPSILSTVIKDLIKEETRPISVQRWNLIRKKRKRNYIIAYENVGGKKICAGFGVFVENYESLHSYSYVLNEGFTSVAHMRSFFVFPQYRKQGVGGSIIDFIEKYSKKLKKTHLSLTYNVKNKVAEEFYKHRNFKLLEKQFVGYFPSSFREANVSVCTPKEFIGNKNHKSVLEESMSADSTYFKYITKHSYEIITAVLEEDRLEENFILSFNSGKDGFMLLTPINKNVLSANFIVFSNKVARSFSSIKDYFSTVGKLCKTKYNADLLSLASIRYDIEQYSSLGFIHSNSAIIKQL